MQHLARLHTVFTACDSAAKCHSLASVPPMTTSLAQNKVEQSIVPISSYVQKL